MLKPKEQKLIKVKGPFIDEIFSLSIIKNNRWQHLQYDAIKTKIHAQCSDIGCSQ